MINYKITGLGDNRSWTIVRLNDEAYIPIASDNRDYQQYLQDIKENGMSIVEVDDCGDGEPDKSMWQYVDNAEELLVNKYGSDQDKLTALREDRYVRAMEAKTPYESMTVAGAVIDNTPQIIKDKYRCLLYTSPSPRDS